MDFATVAARELSDTDLRALLPGVPITQYNELEDKSLGNLIDQKGRGIVLFVQKETSRAVEGHWLGLCRLNEGLLAFDPYGGSRDPWYLDHTWSTSEQLDKLDQEAPILSRIIRHSGLQPVYNTVRLQVMKKGIETCGRHVVVRLWNQHMGTKEYAQWLKSEDGNPDFTVCKLTYEKLGH